MFECSLLNRKFFKIGAAPLAQIQMYTIENRYTGGLFPLYTMMYIYNPILAFNIVFVFIYCSIFVYNVLVCICSHMCIEENVNRLPIVPMYTMRGREDGKSPENTKS